MSSIKVKELNIPTVRELRKICEDNNYEYMPKVSLLKECVKILKALPEFHIFLTKTNFDYYELSYSLFAQIIEYVNICYNENDVDNVKKTFVYLDVVSQSHDEDVLDLLVVGSLELFCRYNTILRNLVELMPKHLKALYLKYFSRDLESFRENISDALNGST